MVMYYESNFDTLKIETNALGLFQINASSFFMMVILMKHLVLLEIYL